MAELTQKRIQLLQYSHEHNGITLTEASTQIYRHKSTASTTLKQMKKTGYLKTITDTPINTSYNKLWIPTEKGEKILEALNT